MQVLQPLQLRSSWSSRPQASTRSRSPGELLTSRVVTFWRQGWQAQASAWGGPPGRPARPQTPDSKSEEMLDRAQSRWAEAATHDSAYSVGVQILEEIREALFGPPAREIAGTCGECGGVADVWLEQGTFRIRALPGQRDPLRTSRPQHGHITYQGHPRGHGRDSFQQLPPCHWRCLDAMPTLQTRRPSDRQILRLLRGEARPSRGAKRACNHAPVCTRGGAAAMVSKRGAGTPENGATNPENGLALILHRYTADLASIS